MFPKIQSSTVFPASIPQSESEAVETRSRSNDQSPVHHEPPAERKAPEPQQRPAQYAENKMQADVMANSLHSQVVEPTKSSFELENALLSGYNFQYPFDPDKEEFGVKQKGQPQPASPRTN